MSQQKPTNESVASGPEAAAAPAEDAAAATEATAESAGPSKAAPSTETGEGTIRNFPLAIYRPSVQYRRYALLAASLVIAAALGGLIGSFSTYSFATPKPAPAEPARNLQAALTQVTKDVAALKASIETSSRAASTQISKLSERFERSERAQADPATKIATLTETVSRLEKRMTANAAASRDITGSVPDRASTKDQSKPTIVEGWILRDVYRGRAMVEHRDSLYEVMPGADLPGIGKVQTITQQNGRWVVVTAKGLIVSMR